LTVEEKEGEGEEKALWKKTSDFRARSQKTKKGEKRGDRKKSYYQSHMTGKIVRDNKKGGRKRL